MVGAVEAVGGPAGMRVLVDATAIPPERRGVGRYVEHVVEELGAMGVDLVVASQRRDVPRFTSFGLRVVPAPSAAECRPLRLVWEQTGLPLLARRVAADVLFSPHYTLPVATRLPRVTTLHDATFFSDPEVHLGVKARFFRGATAIALRLARECLVPSRATRDELVRWAGADPRRLRVVPHGVDLEVFRPPSADEVERFASTHGLLPRAYVAFLGTLEPRKNVPGLVRGWAAAVADAEVPPPLVLAGARGWDRELDDVIAAVRPPARVVRVGYLPLHDLRAMLGGAAVVAYPSRGEGFGLPVLEAMACGATVLTTRRLALPEVGGDAVAYCEPDAESIAESLRGLLGAPARRQALARAAAERARSFTWRRSAEEHLRAFEAALA